LVQAKEYGLVRSSPSFVAPLKNSTLLTEPGDVSDADAFIVILAGAVNVAPFVGELMDTVGGVLEVPPHCPTVKVDGDALEFRSGPPAPTRYVKYIETLLPLLAVNDFVKFAPAVSIMYPAYPPVPILT
jgi:hypothetical protein